MKTNETENTIKDSLKEDGAQKPKRRHRGGVLLRLLIILTLLFIGFYGFILFRQKILDLEAEAIVRARQTLTRQAGNQELILPVQTQPTESPLLETSTPDNLSSNLSATISTQGTAGADFQQTETPAP